MRKLLFAVTFLAFACGTVFAQGNPGACDADADCFHTGCSGQLCSSTDIITTCEFRCEYGCYAAASCECMGHRCAFRHNSALQGCLKSCRGTVAELPLDFTPVSGAEVFPTPATAPSSGCETTIDLAFARIGMSPRH